MVIRTFQEELEVLLKSYSLKTGAWNCSVNSQDDCICKSWTIQFLTNHRSILFCRFGGLAQSFLTLTTTKYSDLGIDQMIFEPVYYWGNLVHLPTFLNVIFIRSWQGQKIRFQQLICMELTFLIWSISGTLYVVAHGWLLVHSIL